MLITLNYPPLKIASQEKFNDSVINERGLGVGQHF